METNLLSIGLLSDNSPEVILDLKNGQGTFLYNHNIKEVKVIKDENAGITITEDAEKATGSMFQYDSLRCGYPQTADNIFATLITAKYPANVESKLVNEYQSAVLGLLDPSYEEPYKAFLRDRLVIRAAVDNDCATINIPTEL